MIKVPVLFLIFNRPDTTSQVFEAIRRAQPNELFIAADGPRENREDEADRCRQVRQIATQVDWECQVKTLFRDKNLGCKAAVSSGIDWFFEHVEEGIIIEDDCVPDQSFFGFCERLLTHYRNDTRVMMICGTNYLQDQIKIEESYYFSNYYPIWGWATWRRAWHFYDVEMSSWEELKARKQIYWLFSNASIAGYYEAMFQLIRDGFDTWDIQWWYACIFQHGLAVVPKRNLISNCGITGAHSNTQGDFRINLPTSPVNYKNLMHPKFVIPDKSLNELTYKLSHAQVDVTENEVKSSNQINAGLLNTFPASALVKNLIKRVKNKIKI